MLGQPRSQISPASTLRSAAFMPTQCALRSAEPGSSANLLAATGRRLYHQSTPRPYLGRPVACTWQTGESAIIAATLGVPVVSDFRPADMAAGGKGAPLVPYLDYVLFRHRRFGRIVQNIGGIGNLTAIPPRATPDEVVAFDTGPGNMVIDAVAERLFDRPYDRNGRFAAKGEPIEAVVSRLLRRSFFRHKPPKTAGREQFGQQFALELLRLCRRADHHDVIATATALTARSIGVAVRDIVLPTDADNRRLPHGGHHVIASLLSPEVVPETRR